MSYGNRRSSRGGGGQQLQQQQKTFSFPMLTNQEILATWEDVPLQAKDLDKPTSASVRAVFETLCDQVIGPCVREEIYNPVEGAMSRIEFPELHEESIQQLTFFRYVTRLLSAAGVHDFTMEDILKPDPKRFRRNLCAIINFQKFRLQCIETFEELHAESQQLVDTHTDLSEDMAAVQERIARIQDKRAADQPQVRKLQEECRALDGEIKARSEEKDVLEHESKQLKARKEDLKDYASSLKFQKHEVRQETARMEGNIVRSPSRLKSELSEQRSRLNTEKAENARLEAALEGLRRKDQVLAKSAAKGTELLALIKQVETAMTDCKAASRDQKKWASSVRGHSNSLRQLQTQKAEAERQVELSKDRLDRLVTTKSLKMAAAGHAVAEARSERDTLAKQRGEMAAKLEEENASIIRLEEAMAADAKLYNTEVAKRRQAFKRLDNTADQSSEMLFKRLSYA